MVDILPLDDVDYGAIARDLFSRAPGTTNFNRLRKRLKRQAGDSIRRYGMVGTNTGEPPKWLICLSGGKDSHALLAILLDLKAHGDLPVDLLACNLDQKQPGFPADTLPNWFESFGMPYRIETRDTYSIVVDKVAENKTFCSLCSRLRRGILYRVAREEGCDAIVLGHHREDALATFMMNLTKGGRLAAMPGKLLNDAGDVTVLRPLIDIEESDLARYTAALNCPIIPCNLCGSQDGLQRQLMGQRLREWEAKAPGTKSSMMRALSHVRPSHLLDTDIFDFQALTPQGDDADVP
ncbi:tRNA 2-thiocytidine biosynthesis protein TtcA [Litorimonas taeanensis]|uniref:tRNA-cytidine(32) 2-sulfurtransferase n=1 Tax=Litorimonas taeanensis TaxID=568099 RepID=A0A420WEB2_9PROT|nr:tRNA 2-thiocytidine(32) synthetase TtcA [Litorimonas taeanensis]RKQ69369.1 tRNA 2-thiocytidine biosynthesis protein TtcA [Litorimonas taeanensis]